MTKKKTKTDHNGIAFQARLQDLGFRADWLNLSYVQKIVNAVGHKHLMFVGGAVRDTILGLSVTDIDAATDLDPDEVERRLKAASIKSVAHGKDHGTITAVEEGHPLEITTLRLDVKTDGRRATVAFTTDWARDARRRDFTINAIYLSPDGYIFDPVGGLQDIREHHIRFIGSPEARIKEDGLRILRYFRFLATIGKGSLPSGADEKPLINAIRSNLSMIDDLSGERIRLELKKWVAGRYAPQAFSAAEEVGVLAKIFSNRDMDWFARWHNNGMRVDAVYDLVPALVCLSGGKVPAGELQSRLKLSRVETRGIQNLHRALAMKAFSESDIRQIIYDLGIECARRRLLTDNWQKNTRAEELLKTENLWHVPVFPVTAKVLMKRFGYQEGRELGRALKSLEQKWRDSDFTLSRDALLADMEQAANDRGLTD